ncbi:BMP family ABC transporter substrate-binding protein [Romboutsia sp.]|uniref:BMP family lipoprotein n=1 Tax=Romboutsia sp. TaxID=1965302 RepID=UPI002BD06806|nr:BMP family ABC transporter substrate-binding protein [Romboutsia sp.]HSQ88365.1 BMP family ABC transporter substrate-binding protein [Romboutsia sp.]
MKLKKVVSLSLALVLSASLLAGCSNNDKNEAKDNKLTIAMITDVAGVNDQSFNQSAWEGLQKAEKELGVEIKYLESRQDSDYATNVETLVDEDVDLILGVGMKLAPAIEEGAKLYPEQKFVIVDETYKNVPDNVKGILFNSQESSYLAGLVAGKMTKTNNIGFIGGMELPVIESFQYGYMAGAKEANPNIELQVQYANSFTDQAKGKAIANQMYSKGADIIFTAGGDVGTGAIEAAKENGKLAIGVDRDQSSLAPDNVLTSAIKRVDVGVFNTVKELVDGKFQGGTTDVYGLQQGAVGIPDTTKNLVPQDIIDYVNKEADKFEKGELKAPKNKEEYDAIVK